MDDMDLNVSEDIPRLQSVYKSLTLLPSYNKRIHEMRVIGQGRVSNKVDYPQISHIILLKE